MKKLIFSLLTILLLGAGTTVYAQGNTDSDDASADATVFIPVTVTSNANLDFGDVFQGNNSSVSAENGANFTVSGSNGETVSLSFELPEGTGGNASAEANTYWLEETGGDELTLTFGAGFANWETGTTYSGTNEFDPASATPTATLDSDGITVWIGGQVEPSVDQTEGSYTGTITLTATYN